MANIASVLKEEIARISRKEARQVVEPLKKQIAVQRKQLAQLRSERADLRRELAARPKRASSAANDAEASEQQRPARFSAAGLRSMRARLGLSAADFGRLLGTSGQSIYNWEQEKTRPRQMQLQKIAGLRGIGKREAKARLESEPPSQ